MGSSNTPASKSIVDLRLLPETWWLYLLECVDGSYYVGITGQLTQRIRDHFREHGCTYTRRHPVARLAGCIPVPDRTTSTRLERKIKRWPMLDKVLYFETNSTPWDGMTLLQKPVT